MEKEKHIGDPLSGSKRTLEADKNNHALRGTRTADSDPCEP